MSGDFEVVPCGTQARLAQVEAERDSMREILDHIPQVEAELAETSDKLHAMTVERDALLAEVERLTLNGTHSCHAECQRPVCRMTRERDALLEALERLLPAYRKAVKLYDPNTDDDLTVAAHNAIAKVKGGGNG